jgi:hypothetical protein
MGVCVDCKDAAALVDDGCVKCYRPLHGFCAKEKEPPGCETGHGVCEDCIRKRGVVDGPLNSTAAGPALSTSSEALSLAASRSTTPQPTAGGHKQARKNASIEKAGASSSTALPLGKDGFVSAAPATRKCSICSEAGHTADKCLAFIKYGIPLKKGDDMYAFKGKARERKAQMAPGDEAEFTTKYWYAWQNDIPRYVTVVVMHRIVPRSDDVMAVQVTALQPSPKSSQGADKYVCLPGYVKVYVQLSKVEKWWSGKRFLVEAHGIWD